MPLPTIGDQHINRGLTNMSIAFLQKETKYAHSNTFAPLPVQSKSDDYWIFPRSYFLRHGMKKRAPGTAAQVSGYKVEFDTYTCEVWSECVPVADQTRANTDMPLNPDRNAVQLLTQHALIQREEEWTDKFFKTGVWTNERAGGATTNGTTTVAYWDTSGADPVDDILTAEVTMEELTGFRPNVLTLGAKVQKALKVSPVIIDRLKYGQTAPGIVTVKDTDLQQLFEVDKVAVASAIHTTSNEGAATDTFGYIAGSNAMLAYANPSPGIEQPSAGYTINWSGFLGASAAGTRIKRYRWEKTASDDTEIDSAYTFKKIAADLGYFFNAVLKP